MLESRAFTDREALAASPPLIDLVGGERRRLLAKLDGADGHALRRTHRDASLTRRTPASARCDDDWRQRVLSAIAHPQVAYLLLMLGMLGLTVELWNPGAIVPGVVGGMSVCCLPSSRSRSAGEHRGLLLIAFGLGLLILELKVPSFGVLGHRRHRSVCVLGSIMLTREVPGVARRPALVVPVALGYGGDLAVPRPPGAAARSGSRRQPARRA